MAYATDDRASEEKVARATVFGNRCSPAWSLARGAPSNQCLSPSSMSGGPHDFCLCSAGPTACGKVARCIDQADVCECLRKIAQQSFRIRIVFFREKADVVGQPD